MKPSDGREPLLRAFRLMRKRQSQEMAGSRYFRESQANAPGREAKRALKYLKIRDLSEIFMRKVKKF